MARKRLPIWRQEPINTIIHVLGFLLSGWSIWRIFVGEQLLLNLFLLFVGTAMIGGLPSVAVLKRLVQFSPASLLLTAGLIVFMYRYFGTTDVTQLLLSTVIAFFVVNNFFLIIVKAVFADE